MGGFFSYSSSSSADYFGFAPLTSLGSSHIRSVIYVNWPQDFSKVNASGKLIL